MVEESEVNDDGKEWSVNFESEIQVASKEITPPENLGGKEYLPAIIREGGKESLPNINTLERNKDIPPVVPPVGVYPPSSGDLPPDGGEKTSEEQEENPTDSVDPDEGKPRSSISNSSKEVPTKPTIRIGYMPKRSSNNSDYEKKLELEKLEKKFAKAFLLTYRANDPKSSRIKLNDKDKRFLYRAMEDSTQSHFEIWQEKGQPYLDHIGQKIKSMSDATNGKNGLSLERQVVPAMGGIWLIEWSSGQTGDALVSLSQPEINDCESILYDHKEQNLSYDDLVKKGEHTEGQKSLLETYFKTAGSHYSEAVKQAVLS